MDVQKNAIPYGQRFITLTDFVSGVRRYMRDHPQLNRLIAGVESSDEDIMFAIDMAISDYNNEPPFTRRYDFNNPPPKAHLIWGTVIELLVSKGLLESRNSIAFNDGGISIGADKDQRTQSWLANFQNRYENAKKKFKVAENIEMAWGVSLSSEYCLINNAAWYSGTF